MSGVRTRAAALAASLATLPQGLAAMPQSSPQRPEMFETRAGRLSATVEHL
jgi:hypothetical protein